MALCTKCGTLMNDEDAPSHVCSSEDIPEKGNPIKKGLKKADIASK
jgi:hypothetical protein